MSREEPPTLSRQHPLGHRLHMLRVHRRLTLMDLAERAQVSVGTVHAIESGRRDNPRIDTLLRLCSALGVSARYFL